MSAENEHGKLVEPLRAPTLDQPSVSPDGSVPAQHVPFGFTAGTVLADRFRIVRPVGVGGMAMVYEATDQILDRRVAIKCAKRGHQKSLPPEARTAREISHFNVCKVYDLHTAITNSGEVDFLSMEFIEGETLWAHIKSNGPLKPAEALALARQICAGLAQAHRQGVIHGDLKLANVILAKAADGGTRAVITDFGLARFVEPDGSRIISRHGGTLDYMAPELLLGERATVASDLYALGVLFHAMLTGHAPKRSDASQAALQEPPTPPPGEHPLNASDATTVTMAVRIVESDWQRQIEDLPPPWSRVVRRSLEPKPERRFGTAQEIAKALEPKRIVLKWATATATIAAALGYWQWQQPPTGPEVRLAVLPFSADGAVTADVASVAVEITDRLSGARRNFSVISPLDAQQNRAETAEKVHAVLGATHALETKLTNAGGQMAVEARLVDLESGRIVQTLKSSYQPGDTATLAKALIGTVNIGLNLKSRFQQEPVADTAYPAYVQGLNMLRQDPRQAADAIPLLEKAVALDPMSALPYAALASAQIRRFRNGDGPEWLERAGETAARAAGINPDSVQVLLVSGQVDQDKGRYEQAIHALSRAATLDPRNAGAWRILADIYEAAGRDQDAIETYRKAVAAEPGGYLPYFSFGNFYFKRHQFKQAEEMWRKVTMLAPGLASGHMNLGLALKQQGRYQESEQSLLKAMELRPSATLLLNIGALYYEQERFTEALHFFQESAKQGPAQAILYRDLGDAYRHLSHPKEATDAYRMSRVKSQEEIVTNPHSAQSRVRLALVSARLGDAHQAECELSQALSSESGNTVTADAVQVCEVLKQRDKSMEILQQAPRFLLDGLARQPDLKELRQDRRFQQLLQAP
jgi:serine/threonine protein kinase/tetratricopeptide (TPR) repeat protein